MDDSRGMRGEIKVHNGRRGSEIDRSPLGGGKTEGKQEGVVTLSGEPSLHRYMD